MLQLGRFVNLILPHGRRSQSNASWKRLISKEVQLPPLFGICFDIDGVLVRGQTPFPESLKAFELLCDKNGHFKFPSVFVTNGCSKNQDKANKLSSWLNIKVETDQMIQAHCPLKLYEEFYKKHCLIIGQGPVAEIAQIDLGFTNVCTIEDISSSYPLLDVVDHEKCNKSATMDKIEIDIPPIDAIVILGEPKHWETPLQLIIDLLLTNGKPSQHGRRVFHQTLPLLACNPDLQYMGRSSHPRYGNGAFLVCLESLFKKLTGHELSYTALVGKPSEITFRYAEHCLSVVANRMKIRHPLKRIYMIGDNLEVDIYGANLYQRYISSITHNQIPTSRHSPCSGELLPQTVEAVESLLVRTGVFGANVQSEKNTERCNKTFSHHHQLHREFLVDDESLFEPNQYLDHILDAVKYILKKEAV